VTALGKGGSVLRDIALVAAGGALGASARWVIGGWLSDRFGASFPWHTLVINITGAFLLGVLMGATLDRALVSPAWRVFIGTGILGGYTTFSTLAYESVALLELGAYVPAALNMFGSGALGIAAAVAGVALGRML
jgi:CrcB protein